MSVTNYREQIRQAVAATVFHSPTWFSWFGQEVVRMPASILRALSADEVRCLILMVLQLQLYEDFIALEWRSPRLILSCCKK